MIIFWTSVDGKQRRMLDETSSWIESSDAAYCRHPKRHWTSASTKATADNSVLPDAIVSVRTGLELA